jgi:hypothetical protein
MNETVGSPRLSRPPISLTELRRMYEQLGQLRSVTLSDGSTAGGEVASSDGGLAISLPSGLRSFWGEVTANLSGGAYLVDQIEDVGNATLSPDPQTSSDWLQGVPVAEISGNPNVPIGTPVRCFPSMNQELPWSFVLGGGSAVIIPTTGGGGSSGSSGGAPPLGPTPPGTILLGGTTVYVSIGGGLYVILCNCGTYQVPGSSSGSSGGGLIQTGCCPQGLPTTLHATVTPVTGCGAMLTSYTLVYDPNLLGDGFPGWTTHSTPCAVGTNITIAIVCSVSVWKLVSWDAGEAGSLPLAAEASGCTPFEAVWNNLIVLECCPGGGGLVTLTVTE